MRAMFPREVFAWALGAGTIAIGLKFATFWNQWVFFPASINLVDTVFLVITGLYLVLGSARSWIRNDDTAVMSPTMGVIMMVAVTVALAVILFFLITHWGG